MKCNKLCFVAQRFERGGFFLWLNYLYVLKERDTAWRWGGRGRNTGYKKDGGRGICKILCIDSGGASGYIPKPL